MYIALHRGITPLGSKPARIQLFRRTPTLRVSFIGCGRVGCSDSATQIASDPHQPNIRETDSTVLRDEDIPLQRRKLHCLEKSVGIAPPSSYRGRAPWYAGTEDRGQCPLTATGLSQEMREAEHTTCQFQRIGPEVFPQELDNTPVFHPRRHHGAFFIIHHDPISSSTFG